MLLIQYNVSYNYLNNNYYLITIQRYYLFINIDQDK